MTLLARAALSSALLLAGPMGLAAWSRWRLGRAGAQAVTGLSPVARLRHGVPALLYFSSPECVSCRTVQRPALDRLLALRRGRLQLVEIDALAHPALADRWGILTVPTTIVLDDEGVARAAHHGVASSEVLAASLDGLPRRRSRPAFAAPAGARENGGT
jgi:thioredoxin-like negative regulator of GroEL